MENRRKNEEVLCISIKDLFMRLCLRWRQAIICALLLAVSLNVIVVVKEYKELENQKQQLSISEEERVSIIKQELARKVEAAQGELSEREIEEVERSVDSYEELLITYNSALEYNEKSLEMKLNPNKVPTIVLQYNVDTNYEVIYPMIESEDNTGSIMDSLCNVLSNEDMYRQMVEVMENKCEAEYLSELIETSISYNNFTVTIMCLTKEDCYRMSEVIKESIKNEKKQIEKTFGKFDLTLLSEQYTEGPDVTVMKKQADQASIMNTIKNTFNNLYYGLTESQKEYYYLMLDSNALERTSNEIVDANIDNAVLQEKTLKIFNVKYIILGALLGWLLVWIKEIIKYIASERLRVVSDLEDVYGINVLGEIRRKKYSRIDAKIVDFCMGKKLISDNEQVELICANLNMITARADIGKITLTSTCSYEEIEEVQKEIYTKLKGNTGQVYDKKSILYDVDALNSLADTEGVVLIEKIDQSKYINIKKIVNQCEKNNIPIVGSVVVK